MTRNQTKPEKNLAATYVRMSTEHQQYSTSNQMDVMREYAQRRGWQIDREYSDEGKSGLNIQGRDSLAQMIRDVQSGEARFGHILVYDISRWGRFQDADESAYYEYICRQACVAVHYCAEQFENDGSPVSTIVKGVKRAMAGEYSRELSSKVFQGACRLVQLGFRQGGMAGYGLRRVLVDQGGQRKASLRIGEQKSIQTDRVVLVPGPDDEVQVVRGMYEAFVMGGKMEAEIAADLNSRGLMTDLGRPWTRATVHQILTNEKYIGNNVYPGGSSGWMPASSPTSLSPCAWRPGTWVFETTTSCQGWRRKWKRWSGTSRPWRTPTATTCSTSPWPGATSGSYWRTPKSLGSSRPTNPRCWLSSRRSPLRKGFDRWIGGSLGASTPRHRPCQFLVLANGNEQDILPGDCTLSVASP